MNFSVSLREQNKSTLFQCFTMQCLPISSFLGLLIPSPFFSNVFKLVMICHNLLCRLRWLLDCARTFTLSHSIVCLLNLYYLTPTLSFFVRLLFRLTNLHVTNRDRNLWTFLWYFLSSTLIKPVALFSCSPFLLFFLILRLIWMLWQIALRQP